VVRSESVNTSRQASNREGMGEHPGTTPRQVDGGRKMNAPKAQSPAGVIQSLLSHFPPRNSKNKRFKSSHEQVHQ
jgi:hypothetical protein